MAPPVNVDREAVNRWYAKQKFKHILLLPLVWTQEHAAQHKTDWLLCVCFAIARTRGFEERCVFDQNNYFALTDDTGKYLDFRSGRSAVDAGCKWVSEQKEIPAPVRAMYADIVNFAMGDNPAPVPEPAPVPPPRPTPLPVPEPVPLPEPTPAPVPTPKPTLPDAIAWAKRIIAWVKAVMVAAKVVAVFFPVLGPILAVVDKVVAVVDSILKQYDLHGLVAFMGLPEGATA